MSEAASIPDEVKRIQRCHALFVQKRILKTDPLYIAVKNGTKSGTKACMELLAKADIGADGKIKGDLKDPNNIGSRILSTFNEFHQKNLSSPDLTMISLAQEQAEFYDILEPAYQFTYSVFGSGQKYSDLVTRNFHIRAIRNSEKGENSRTHAVSGRGINGSTGFNATFLVQGSTRPNATETAKAIPWAAELVSKGILIGLTRDQRENRISRYVSGATVGNIGIVKHLQDANNALNSNMHLGGGILGSQSYMTSLVPSGSSHYRAWSKAVVSDLLCRELPVLRAEDVRDDVREKSDFSWRNGTSCMQCHSTLDPMQATIRNRVSFSTLSSTVVSGISFWVDQLILNQYKNSNDHYPESSSDPAFKDYAKRNPLGKLRFRSYTGAPPINIEVMGAQDLGKALSTTDDLYACAAKRYFHFLTGIDVNLDDEGSTDFKLSVERGDITKKELEYRERVIKLGQNLKNDQAQSVKKLLEEIIASDTFIHPDKGQ